MLDCALAKGTPISGMHSVIGGVQLRHASAGRFCAVIQYLAVALQSSSGYIEHMLRRTYMACRLYYAKRGLASLSRLYLNLHESNTSCSDCYVLHHNRERP